MNQANRSRWLKIAGSVLIFVSWCFQNFLQQDWKGQREDLDRLRQRLTTNDLLANVWLAAYQSQQAKPEIDLIASATMGLQYINFSHHVRASASRWLGNPDSDMVKLSRSYFLEAESSRKSGDLSRILDLVGKARDLDESVAPTMASAMDEKYAAISDSEKFWEKLFLMAYVLGALTLGSSFLLSQDQPQPPHPQAPQKGRKK